MSVPMNGSLNDLATETLDQIARGMKDGMSPGQLSKFITMNTKAAVVGRRTRFKKTTIRLPALYNGTPAGMHPLQPRWELFPAFPDTAGLVQHICIDGLWYNPAESRLERLRVPVSYLRFLITPFTNATTVSLTNLVIDETVYFPGIARASTEMAREANFQSITRLSTSNFEIESPIADIVHGLAFMPKLAQACLIVPWNLHPTDQENADFANLPIRLDTLTLVGLQGYNEPVAIALLKAVEQWLTRLTLELSPLVKDKGRGNPRGLRVRVFEGKGRGRQALTLHTREIPALNSAPQSL